MTTNAVRERLAEWSAYNEDGSHEVDELLRSTMQASLALEAVGALKAAGYKPFIRLYGGHLLACVHLAEGRVLALDPMGRCHWESLSECIDADDSVEGLYGNPEIWDVVAYDADGQMLDFV